MSHANTDDLARGPLYDELDDAGRAWLDEVVKAFNDGGYEDAVDAFLDDEAAVHGSD